jgi:hypothetical protein
VRAVFGHKARIQGVLAKLRIVEMAYGTGEGSEAPDLEAYQRGSWLGSTIKDLDRMAGGASWQENGMVRTDDREDRLVAGVIVDLEGIDDKQTGTSRAPLTTAPVGRHEEPRREPGFFLV